MLNLIQSAIAIVGLVRALWGLLRDVKKEDPAFRPADWAKRTHTAIRHYRKTGANYAEVSALARMLGDKCAQLPAKNPWQPPR